MAGSDGAVRAFATFLFGHGLALMALWSQRFLVGWYLWRTTQSPLVLSAALICELVPGLLCTGAVGIILDRSDQRRVVVIAQISAALAALLISAVFWIEVHVTLLTMAVLVVSGIAGSFILAGRFSLVADYSANVAGTATAATGVALIGQLATLAAPLAAGLGLKVASEWQGLLAVGTCACAAAIALPAAPATVARTKLSPMPASSNWRPVFWLLRNSRGLAAVLALFFITQVAGRSITDLLPGFVASVLAGDSDLVAYLTAMTGAGALAATGAALLFPKFRSLPFMFAVAIAMLFSIALMASARDTSVQFAAMFIAGAALALAGAYAQVFLQKKSPNSMRGRLMSLYTLLWRGAPLAGAAIVGPLTAWLGMDWLPWGAGAVLVIGLLLATCVSAPLLNRA